MGTGWRRAFCTSIPRDPVPEKQQNHPSPTSPPSPSPSPRSCAKLSFFSNPSTPRLQSQPVAGPGGLRCRTAATSPTTVQDSPRLVCKTALTSKSPRLFQASNPSSPKSPSRFALFRSPRLRLSKSSCGICLQSVKTGQGTAIFTAECSHAFHFPCIAAHVRKQGCLVCPVCNATWREVPLLAIHRQPQPQPQSDARNEAAAAGAEEDKLEKPKSGHNNSSLKTTTSSESRLYDDDEPLISPRFNPIPEADEDDGEDEEIGEFQGFFANPSSAKSEVVEEPSASAARVVDAKLLPEAAVVSAGRSHESYAVALRVRAPAPQAARNGADPNRRAPVDLVTVLDVSGSMTGAKLHMLRRAMRLVVASLGPADRLSIVAFSGGAKRLLPLRRMTPHGQRAARRIVDRLACGNGTCVGEALRKATKVLEDRRERNPVASIMLLSDGQEAQESSARRRLNPAAASAPSTRFAHVEIPVHSFGFGASSGGGGGGGGGGQDAFAKCIGGLLSVVVQDLRLNLGFASGEIAGAYSCAGRPALLGSSSIRLGDMYAEEERELLLELRVPAASIGAHHVMSVGFSYRDPATQEVVHCKEQALLVPRPHAVRSSDPKIERLRNLFVATRAIAEARRMTEHNDLSGAHHLLASARALLLQSTSISADTNLRGLDAELAELQARRHHHHQHYVQQQQQQRGVRRSEQHPLLDDNGEPLTPTSAWRAAEQLAKVAIMRKSMNRVSDLHGFENARF